MVELTRPPTITDAQENSKCPHSWCGVAADGALQMDLIVKLTASHHSWDTNVTNWVHNHNSWVSKYTSNLKYIIHFTTNELHTELSTLCPKKLHVYLCITLSNLNQLSNFFHCRKSTKIATWLVPYFPSHLRHVATLHWEIKVQIQCSYGRKCNF